MNAFKTIHELQADLAAKKYSKEELLTASLDRIAQVDPQLQATLQVFGHDDIIKNSKSSGPLAGIPGILKDNISQNGYVTSCASKILENYVAAYDATVTTRLKESGAFLVGRANLDEFAMGSSTETSAFFKTKNPWNTKCVPGGSSGGSAAAVASGMVPWALGTDTGGSVRQPAGFCGITGLKPTYGAVSRYGVVAYASSLDQVGVFTRDVRDCAQVFSVLAGHDAKDASTLTLAPQDYTKNLASASVKGKTIGVIDNALHAQELDPAIRMVIEESIIELEKAGAIIKRVQLPALDLAAATYFIISRAEAASNLARFDGIRYGYRSADAKNLNDVYVNSKTEGFGLEVRSRLIIGNYVLSAGHADQFYNKAKLVQRRMRFEFLESFKEVDLLLMPTQACTAFEFGAFDNNKLQMDLQDYFTAGVNIAGVPAISVPAGFVNNMPVGVQLIGPHLSEDLLFEVAHAFQQLTDWHTKTPQL